MSYSSIQGYDFDVKIFLIKNDWMEHNMVPE